jgi:hypothetical protein
VKLADAVEVDLARIAQVARVHPDDASARSRDEIDGTFERRWVVSLDQHADIELGRAFGDTA